MSNCMNISRLTLAAALSAASCGDSSPATDLTKTATTKSAEPTNAGSSAVAEVTPSSSDSSSSGSADAGDARNDEDYGNAFSSGEWRGYFWTNAQGAGTTISPRDFSAQTSGMPRCVSGSVGVTTDNTGIAILGANLKEDATGKMSVTPTKQGVTVFVMNNAGSPLLFQVEGPDGRWCTYLNGGGGFMPWEKLNTACWDDSGSAYDREPIHAAALIVPGNSSAPVAFDFCLLRLEEADGW